MVRLLARRWPSLCISVGTHAQTRPTFRILAISRCSGPTTFSMILIDVSYSVRDFAYFPILAKQSAALPWAKYFEKMRTTRLVLDKPNATVTA